MANDKVEMAARGMGKKDPAVVLQQALQQALGQVWRYFSRDAADFIELRVKQRGDGDWLAVLKVADSDGTPLVAFGQGYSGLTALLGVQASASAGKWHVDKPWKPDK